jgi:superfamily II DNA or RNA helicase
LKITVAAQIHIRNCNISLRQKVTRDLTIKNPEHVKKKAMGLPVWGCPPEIKIYTVDPVTKDILIPRGYLTTLWRYWPDRSCYDFCLHEVDPVKFISSIQLRNYQKPAIDSVLRYKQGVVNMPCGAGKTITGLGTIATIGQPALWITHTKDLLQQSLDNAIKVLNLKRGEYGILNADEWTIGSHITFGMVQSLANRDLSDIVNRFGTIVIDECHHVFKSANSVAQFYNVISQFPAKFRIGLTATAHRSDGLIDTMFHTIGPIIYQVKQDELPQENIVVPTVEFVLTNFNFDSDEEDSNKRFRLMLNDMTQDALRDRLILKKLHDNAENYNLILGDSLEHLDNLCERIGDYFGNKYRCAFICGKTPKRQREATLREVREGKIHFLFATYQLAKEGLDIPRLDRLHLITPKRDKTIIQQSVGRIMRKFEGKTDARVYDFLDVYVGTCINQARARKKVYIELGCDIKGWPKERKR